MLKEDLAKVLGRGMIAPVLRKGSDFEYGAGVDDVRACLRQILMTEPGELPWDPDFGIALSSKRHQNITEEYSEELAIHVRTALEKYEKRAIIDEVLVGTKDGTQLIVRIYWRALLKNPAQTLTVSGSQTDTFVY